ncbi:hypothetical protein [Xenorhabdus bovienii]|nr:hypothetical protein [Xenorhabdus bovienii]MDE1474926.1 hypothetical protein [Xenorhabdus bovienii]MDE1482198.1 hypothetical protein [Xenorhabdus bovienii]MDE9432885.1 hypothetical protein [Xenorhabdus bovienii]MDE9460489.1 hypothetical protein [Xenorhabdus bovienii]MDE9465118.1 hypothetical protein [Xenorhabdus bovienii]
MKNSLDSKVNRTLRNSRQKKQRPEVLGTTIEASNHNVKETYAMAGIQHTQTRPKFTCLIASDNRRLIDIHSQRLIAVLAGISSLSSVSRQEVRRG